MQVKFIFTCDYPSLKRCETHCRYSVSAKIYGNRRSTKQRRIGKIALLNELGVPQPRNLIPCRIHILLNHQPPQITLLFRINPEDINATGQIIPVYIIFMITCRKKFVNCYVQQFTGQTINRHMNFFRSGQVKFKGGNICERIWVYFQGLFKKANR